MARRKGDGRGNHGVSRGPDKVKAETRKLLKDVVMSPKNVDRIEKCLDKFWEKEEYDNFMKYIKELLPFFVPKQAAVTVSDGGKKSDFRSELAEMAENED